MRLLTFALVVAAAAADDSKNETLDEGYSLAGLQLNLSTCDLFIVALAMAENSPLIDSFEAGPAETLRQEPHLARCAVGADSPLTGPGPGHLAASPMLVAGTIHTIADKKAYSGGDPNRPPPSLADFAEVVSPASAAILREYGRKATHRGGSYTEDPHPDYAEEYAEL